MKFTTKDGKEWEFKGEYHTPKAGDWFLSMLDGEVIRAGEDSPDHSGSRRGIVFPVRQHTFGGVTFEETGEKRQAGEGEWCMVCDRPYLPSQTTGGKYRMLRPVSIEEK